MSEDDFIAALQESQAGSKDLPGLDVLKDFCAAIKRFVGGPVDCEPIPSHTVNLGQEYKVILTYYPAGYSLALVRAYLNAEGRPHLDVYDGRGPQSCGDVAGLGTRLRDFLAAPGVADMVRRVRQHAEARR